MRSRHFVVCSFRLPNNSLEPTWPARHRLRRSSVSLGWPGGAARCRLASLSVRSWPSTTKLLNMMRQHLEDGPGAQRASA
jgi:hypothetical protein